jgi:hypothetical protein
MRDRDRASASGRRYKHLRNRVVAMVKRDRLRTNLARLRKANGESRVLWSLAGEAMGKPSNAPLPTKISLDGHIVEGDTNVADTMNNFFVKKVRDLRAGIPELQPSLQPPTSADTLPFYFSFASAGKIAKVVRGLKATEALGVDGIPVSVLKKGVEVLAAPLAHLVNQSLASGIVPNGFKVGIIVPGHKGKGKSMSDAASYRPVSILPAMSKVLETVVKADLEAHLSKTNAHPSSQHGFRPGHSTTDALASAQAEWLCAKAAGKVVGVMAFDLSAAFDTVDKAQLLPKLETLGITSSALSWFSSYLTGGKQSVCWNNVNSPLVDVEYGVRQGSILGPILYLVLVADLPACIGVSETENSLYADDTSLWATADDVDSVVSSLQKRAAALVVYTSRNGLVLNAAKTQLLIGGARNSTYCVHVGDAVVKSSEVIELLGIRFDRNFSTAPYDIALVRAARQRASLIARLAHYVPRGFYLRQLARGLLYGKIGYAVACVVPPRLDDEPASATHKSIQVAINDVARTITGVKRMDRIKIPDLLFRAGLPSLNSLAVTAVATEAWKAANLPGCPLHSRIFPAALIPSRPSRSNAAGIVDHLRGCNTLVTHAAALWRHDALQEVREASTKGVAIAAVKRLSVPI